MTELDSSQDNNNSTMSSATAVDVNPSKSTSKSAATSATIVMEGFHIAYYAALVAWSWGDISKNITRNCFLAGAMVFSLFLLKIVDAMVDDGLSKSTWKRMSTAAFLSLLGVALMVSNDFCAIFLAGLTIGCSLAGKIDCIEFQLVGSIWMFTYVILSLFVDTSRVNFSDVIIFVLIELIEEFLHDNYGFDSKKRHGKYAESSKFVMDCFCVFADHRMILGVTIATLYTWKGYNEAAIIMVSQDIGYDVGTLVSKALLKRKEVKK